MAKEDETAPRRAIDLREFYPEVGERAQRKVLASLDEHCRVFIANSPFVCIGTADSDGRADVSPRGDPPGFVHVADDHTLLIPDRPGNNRLDTMQNLQSNPAIGLLFLIPGVDETLRVNGTGRVVTDAAELARFEYRRHVPAAGIEVGVREAFLHCAKALRRSALWDPASRIDRSSFPRAGDILADHVKGPMTADEVEEYLQDSNRKDLYGD